MLIAIDDDDSVFPHDRVVPEDMVNFRVNGKYKNKIPITTAENADGGRPNIEVAGQLPPDTFDLRLKANAKPTHMLEKVDPTSVAPIFPAFGEEVEQPTILTGIGVAEPVLETDLG